MRPRSIRPLLALLAIAFTALAITGTGTARAALSWSGFKLIDRTAPFGTVGVINNVSCPTGTFCLALGNLGTVVRANAITPPAVVRQGVNSFGNPTSLSCPYTNVCYGVQGTQVLRTTNPGAAKPIFSKVTLRIPLGYFQSIDCTFASLCVATATNGQVWTSTRPTGPASAWRSTATLATGPRTLNAVGCAPEGNLCVAETSGIGGSDRQLLTTLSPTGGAASWVIAPAPGTGVISSISCASDQFCVAISSNEIFSSPDPAAGGSTWTATQVVGPMQSGLVGIGCGVTMPSSCIAADGDGSVFYGSGTTAAPTWTQSPILTSRGFERGMDCLVTARANCLVPIGFATGGIARVLGPQGSTGPSATVSGASGITSIFGLSCPSARLCVGVDGGAGSVLRTTTPLGPASGWRRTVQSAVSENSPEARSGLNGLRSVSCPTVHFCAATGPSNNLLISNSPGTAAQWRVINMPFYDEESAGTFPAGFGPIWCTSSTMCVTVGDPNKIFASTRPGGGASAWRAFQVGFFNEGWTTVACRDRTLCIVGDTQNGRLAVSTAPTQSWRQFALLGGGHAAPAITAVTCNRDRGACLVGTVTGALWSSTHPARGRSAFRRIKLSSRAIVGLACRSQHLCVAIDQLGHVFSSTNPGGPLRTWTHKTLDAGSNWPGGERLTAVTCAPGAACLVGDAGGRVYSAR
ncbi:MAG: hypothetical protein FWD04_09865 [Conexibacteraceae bacterium]|nr:hypothetical protein [Conexibacteraceae bacterium]